jgi:hypothetical protein
VDLSASLESTLEALTLGPEHDAMRELARGLAAAITADPSNAALWREYRAALSELMTVGGDDGSDEAGDFLTLVRTPLGDPADAGPADGGSRARRGGKGARPAVDAVAGTGRARRSRTG